MQRLKELSEDLGSPGQQALWREAQKRRIPVSRSQVYDFVTRQAERQVHVEPLPQAKGKTVAEDVNARFMLDLVRSRWHQLVFWFYFY